MQHGKQLRPTAATDEGGDRNGKLLWRNFSEGELGNTTYHQVSIQILDVKVAFIFWTLPVDLGPQQKPYGYLMIRCYFFQTVKMLFIKTVGSN